MQVYTISGIRNSCFDAKDGSTVEGNSITMLYPIYPEKGKGFEAERVFLTKAKLKNISSKLELNSTVQVIYNRYGKVDDIVDVK
jgi:hypothetical protein